MDSIYCVYTDGKTFDHSFIYKEFPKESLEKLPHIKELYRGSKDECLQFRENLRNEYLLSDVNKSLKLMKIVDDVIMCDNPMCENIADYEFLGNKNIHMCNRCLKELSNNIRQKLNEKGDKMTDTEKLGVNELVGKLNIKEDEIMELLKENSKLEGKLADLTSEYYELENLKNNEIAELKAQIEKMKCCGNCSFSYCKTSSEHIDKDGNIIFHCWNIEKRTYCDVGKNGKYQCWQLRN